MLLDVKLRQLYRNTQILHTRPQKADRKYTMKHYSFFRQSLMDLFSCIRCIDREGAARSKETIIDVVSHQDAAWLDHEFQSLTYENYLREEISTFFKKFK